jgi:ParB/RepB/Spo0J family partition protein
MTEPTTAMIDIERIAVEEGFNPRGDFNQDELAELAASVREQGIITALTVCSDGNGGYVLIAGGRRLEAVKQAGLERVPVVIRSDEGALAAARAENLIRADLDPIEEARVLKRLATAEQLATHKRIAARVSRPAAYVSQRLRLLALPEACQAQVAAGAVPVAAERDLRKIAKVSPEVAEGVCKLVERGEIEGRDLLERFDEVLCTLAEARFEATPTMVDVRGARLSALVADPDRRASLAERLNSARPYNGSDDPVIHFDEAEVDAARAAGCLVEYAVDHSGWSSTIAFLCDPEFAADLALRAVERIERQAGELLAESLEGEVVPSSPEEVKEARRVARDEAKAEAASARTYNLDLGRKLVARRGAKSRKAHSLARAKTLAALLLSDNRSLAASGLRLVLPQLQDMQVKKLKCGEERERITCRDIEECRSYLASRIAEARSADEVLELLADALIAALAGDERELARSRRVSWHSPAQGEVEKLLAPDIKAVRPRRPRACK